MEFRILGPVHILADGREDSLSGTKQRTMFAALVLAGGRAVSDEHLGRMLWDTNPPGTAGAQIHTYASRIRRRVGSEVALVRIRSGYRLLAERVPSDLGRFAELSQGGLNALREQRFEAAAERLREALGCWHGEALADVTDHLAQAERPQLEEARLEALEARIEVDLILGRHRQLISELTGLVSQHPMRERFRALLMTALYRSERQAEAMSLYLDGRRILADELGVEPGRLLARTYEAILSGEVRTAMPHQLVN
ncbi:BTAD domain-containing putative transcriptional regulator [Kitasatospora sp. NPDC093550]|uniref:AfsR/SARP family transcriptional regulator n=1 Tax=Kitasatospora sp. NPDC093550 TaxID=3364089 RepID=UPI0037FB44F9